MVTKLGGKWDTGDRQSQNRNNMKQALVEVGSVLAGLDYVTNLTSRYPFNSSPNDVIGANNLTLTGSPSYADGIYGKALALNGSSQYAQAGSSSVFDFTTGGFTFTAWVYLNSLATTQMLIAKRDPAVATNKGYRIYVNTSGKIVVEFCDGSASVITLTGSATLATATWYFIAVSFDRAGSVTIYLDAVSDGSLSISAQSASISNTQVFTVGRNSDAGSNYANIRIDQLQCFSAALLQADVDQIFSDCHGLQEIRCLVTGSGFAENHAYNRNAENTAWLEKVLLAGSLTHQAGDIIKDNGTDWARLARGTAGQVLRVNAAGTDSAWETLSGVMVSISRDNTGGSAACTGSVVTAASYSLAANSYTSIYVVATGKWTNVNNAGEDPETFEVLVDIGGTTKSFRLEPLQATALQVSDNTGDWFWTVQFSAALAAGGTIAIKGDHNGTASRTISCSTLYVFGII